MVGQTLKSYFVSMPDSIIPLLTKINREDCIDFLDSNMKAEVKNRFGKVSELKKITDNYLLLQVTPNSYVEMKLLSVNDSTKIIGVVKSFKAKAVDSSLAFYSSDWKKLNSKSYITLLDRKSDTLKDSTLTANLPTEEINDIMNIPLEKMSFQEENNNLIIENTSSDTLDKEILNNAELPKNDIKTYIWENGRYILK